MAEVNVRFGGASIETLVLDLQNTSQVHAADLLYALNRQKSRILTRTAAGVDLDGAPFAPYSTRGPYYFYPGKAAKNRGAAAGRFAKKVGGKKTTVGVKFSSYAAFKSALGRSSVDLTGPSAPHMLQAIQVKTSGAGKNLSGTIGIYGPEADRAEGHNVGAGHLPKREFFGFGNGDEDAMAVDVQTLIDARLNKT